MRTCEAQEWQKVSPLLYSYLSSVPAPEYSSISRATFSKQADKSYFKFEEYRAIIAGSSSTSNGLLTINTLLVPQAKDLDDDRVRAVLSKVCELSFESEVTHFEQSQRGSIGQPFLAVVERRTPLIYIYESAALQKLKEKSIINPRKILRGHESEVTALRCSNRGEVLSGAKNGDVRLHPPNSEETSVIYKYHREQVNDFCWLTQQEDSHFLTASADGFIYVWDRRTSLPATKIEPKQGELTCLEYLRDNCFLSGGKDGTVKLYDIRSGVNKFYIFKDHTAGISSLKRLEGKEGEVPHQVLFASGAINGEVMLWADELEFAHLAHRSEVQSIAYEGSSDLFATVEKKTPAVCLWKPAIFNYQ